MKILNILVRRYLALDRLEEAVSFYETLIGRKAHLRFSYPERHLELAQVDNILFIAGTQESLAPFTATLATFMVVTSVVSPATCPPSGRKSRKRRSRCRRGGTCWSVIPTACASNMWSITTSTLGSH
jgi:hypothetical protein